MDIAEGLALLGSPNGRGADSLLLEHKKTFEGQTTIGKVMFYCSVAKGGGWEMNLIFHVVKGEKDKEKEEEEGEGVPATMTGLRYPAEMLADVKQGSVLEARPG